MIDTFTKLIAKKLLQNLIHTNGAVERVEVDRGSQFKSLRSSQELWEEEIVPAMSAIRHPKGSVEERTNEEVDQFLGTLLKGKHMK